MNRLRPLSIGEILDVAFKLYFRHWVRFAATVAVVVVPIQIVDAVIRLSTIDSVSGKYLFYTDHTAYNTGVLVTAVLDLALSLFVTAVAFRAVSEAYMGQIPSIGGSLRFALRRVPSLLWVDILFGLGVVLALILLILPGVWLYVAWSVAVPALMVEGCRGRTALSRSRELVRGRWWQTFAVLLVAAIIIRLIASVVVTLARDLIVAHTTSLPVFVLVNGLLSGIVEVLVLPVAVAVTTVLYFDLRVRKEGFDLSLMIDALGLPGAGGLPEGADGAPVGIAGLPAPPPPSTSVAPSGWAPPIAPDVGLPDSTADPPDQGLG